MELKFLDTNVILRFLTKDHPEQSMAALALLEQLADGRLAATTSESVIVEVVQVLSSRALYSLSRAEVMKHVRAVLGLKGLKLPGKGIYRAALDIYSSTNVDFVDALTAAQMKHRGIATILSFDRHFDRLPGVRREEPKAGQ